MRLHYVLLLVAAVFLSSIEASTATTATSINSRRLVSAEQDKTDGTRFLRTEVKDEDDDDDNEHRGPFPSPVGAITKLFSRFQSKLKRVDAVAAEQKAKWESHSDDFFETLNINLKEKDVLQTTAWIKSMKDVNTVNPEVYMFKTLVTNGYDGIAILRWIEMNKGVGGINDVLNNMQKLIFSGLKKGLKKKKLDFETWWQTYAPNAYNPAVDAAIFKGYKEFLKPPKRNIQEWESHSDDFFQTHNINLKEKDDLQTTAWIKSMKDVNTVNPEVYMFKTLVTNGYDGIAILRWIEMNKGVGGINDVLNNMQKLIFSKVKKGLKEEKLDFRTWWQKYAPKGDNAVDSAIFRGFDDFLNAPKVRCGPLSLGRLGCNSYQYKSKPS